MPSKLGIMPSSCGYSRASVFMQCGQVVRIFRLAGSRPSKTELSISAVCWAIIWKRNSLPERRAGSPVQLSSLPSTTYLTPAMCSSSAVARTVFLALSSNEPAQPIQYKYSTSSASSPS